MLLLLVVSAVTFAIFFLVPRLGGQTLDSMAAQYVGKSPDPDVIAAVKKNLGLDQPLYLQYWNFVKGIVVGADYQFGPDPVTCNAPASATPSRPTPRSGRSSSTVSRSPCRWPSAPPSSGSSPVSRSVSSPR